MSCILLQPFDIIKTQVQECSNQVTRKAFVRQSDHVAIVRQIYSRGGIFSFWKGLSKKKLFVQNHICSANNIQECSRNWSLFFMP